MALLVQQPSAEVVAMAKAWPIQEALMGGTMAMRQAARALLPKWPNEELNAWEQRCRTATLFPAYTRTVGVMAGKPFSKQLTIGEDVPPRIKDWCDDIDLQGNNLHSFAADMLAEAVAYGLCGVLVDFPVTGSDVRTVADEESIGVRPYFVPVRHAQILGWKAQSITGAMMLTQLRIAEVGQVDDGDFGSKSVNRVRVLGRGVWDLWEQIETTDKYALVQSGTTTLDQIPFVPFYGRRKGYMMGESPLIDLAHLNVKHWQSQSDQDNILHVARVPILAVIGVDAENDQWSLTVGASSAVRIPLGGDMKFVEHSGRAIDAGQAALDKLEQQMIQTGAELLVRTPGLRSATESNNEAEANKSELQRIVESFEDGLDQTLQLMAEWVGEPQGGHVSLFKDFGASSLSDASSQLVLAMQAQGLITKKTAIIEQQRRGMLSPDIDPDDELSEVEAEGPSLGTMGGPKLDHAIEPAAPTTTTTVAG